MSLPVVVYVLTGLAVVAVVLTRVRLRTSSAAGAVHVSSMVLNLHTTAGGLALVLWVSYLALGERLPFYLLVGIVAVGLWWVTAFAGLALLARWIPTRGKHASHSNDDSWSEGPGLSVLAHLGMLVGACVFTWAYMMGSV